MGNSVKLSPRGFKLLASSAPVAALSLALRDPLLLAAVICLWLYITVEFIRVSRSLKGLSGVVIKPGSVEATLTAGTLLREPLMVESGLQTSIEIHPTLEGASVEPAAVAPGNNSLALSFTPPMSGRFKADSLTATLGDRYGLLVGSGEVGFSVSFQVYPRVFAVAVRAVQFLAESGIPAEGEYATLIRGRGLEYAETREYVPGDPVSLIDWKALARTGTPYVKQYYLEGGGGAHVVYDEVTPDPVSLDELNSGFLELVLALTGAGMPLRLSVLERGGVREVAHDPYDSLRAALRICLSGSVEEFREYYHLVEPLKTKTLDAFLMYPEVRASSHEPYPFYDASQQVIVVSALCGDPVPLHRLFGDSRHSGDAFLLRWGEPWVWAPSLFTSVTMYGDVARKIRALNRSGVVIYDSLEDAMRRLRTSQEMFRRVV